MDMASPETRLSAFIARYSPEVAATAHAALDAMRARLPGATQMVYDNYNALAIGFGPSERALEAIFSIALFPRWVSLFFLQGAALSDPRNVLKGSGKVARHVVLASAADLDLPAIRELMEQALETAAKPLDRTAPGRLIVKSVSAAQRPRRPVEKPRRK